MVAAAISDGYYNNHSLLSEVSLTGISDGTLVAFRGISHRYFRRFHSAGYFTKLSSTKTFRNNSWYSSLTEVVVQTEDFATSFTFLSVNRKVRFDGNNSYQTTSAGPKEAFVKGLAGSHRSL